MFDSSLGAQMVLSFPLASFRSISVYLVSWCGSMPVHFFVYLDYLNSPREREFHFESEWERGLCFQGF